MLFMDNRNPSGAIRLKCLNCCLDSSHEVKLCSCENICVLHPFRTGKAIKGASKLKAIRQYCLGCGEGTHKAVQKCQFTDCPLYPYRFGKNPNRKRNLTDEERKNIAERLQKKS